MKRRGLTLVEVLVALALLALLAGSLLAFTQNLARQRAAVSRDAERVIAGTTLFDRIEAGVTTALAAGLSGEGGVVVSADRLEVLGARWRSTPESQGLCTLVVSVRADAVTMTERSLSGSAETSAALEGIGRVRFRAHDGEAWRESFDTGEAGRLPLAIEVAVWYPRAVATSDGVGDAGELAPDRRRVIAVPDPWPMDASARGGGSA